MSTNYEWWIGDTPEIPPIVLPTGIEVHFTIEASDPNVHIGKRYSKALGRTGFIWAQEPQQVKDALRANLDKEVVIDEYGRKLTGQEMLDVFGAASCFVYENIGERFS